MSELKPITCKAAVLKKEGTPIVVENVIVPVPTEDQVRLRMISAGICASDAHVACGEFKADHLPLVLGHEGLAVVESVGDKVTEVKVGDLVLTSIISECGKCGDCKNPQINFCPIDGIFSPAVSNMKLVDGTDVWGFFKTGVFSEYVVLKENSVVKVDPRLNQENACIISCAVQTGFYSATKLAKVTPNSTVAVWGLGAIGLNAVYGCKFNGAKNIIGIDINNGKKQVALEFGCTEFLNPKELDKPVEKYLQEKYGGLHYAIECVGHEKSIQTAFNSLTATGTLALVGVNETANISFPLMHMLTGRTITGGFFGNKRAKEGFKELGDLYLNGQYNIDRLVSHRFKLEQINEAFQTLKEGKCIRSIIVFDK